MPTPEPQTAPAPGQGAMGQQWRKLFLLLLPSLEEGASPSPIHRPAEHAGARRVCSPSALAGRGKVCVARSRAGGTAPSGIATVPCPLTGTPRWENGLRSAPLPASNGAARCDSAQHQEPFPEASARCHGWMGLGSHPCTRGETKAPPPAQPWPRAGGDTAAHAAQHPPRGNAAHPPGGRRADERIRQVPSSPPPDPAEAISFQQERHAPGPFSYDSEV